MRIYRFDRDASWPVFDHGISFSLTRLLWVTAGEVRVDFAYLEPGDRVGEHEGRLPQLFCVVDGSGRVTGTESARLAVAPGMAIFCAPGERHAAGTESGMSGVIIQAESLDPEATLTSAGDPEDRAFGVECDCRTNERGGPLDSKRGTEQSGLHVYVDPNRCIANAKCTAAAPGIFVLDDETGVAVIENEDRATVEQFFAAARVCPTQAIIIEQYGRRVFPRILTPMFGKSKSEGEDESS